jgi:hypothetical protein
LVALQPIPEREKERMTGVIGWVLLIHANGQVAHPSVSIKPTKLDRAITWVIPGEIVTNASPQPTLAGLGFGKGLALRP